MFFSYRASFAWVTTVLLLLPNLVEAGKPRCCCCQTASGDKGANDGGEKGPTDGQAKDDDAVSLPGGGPFGSGPAPAVADGAGSPTNDASTQRHVQISNNLATSGNLIAQLLRDHPGIKAHVEATLKAAPAESEVERFLNRFPAPPVVVQAPVMEAPPAPPVEVEPMPAVESEADDPFQVKPADATQTPNTDPKS